MASIDYQGAKAEIENIFSNADTTRKIIFWYDAPKNFEEDIKNSTFQNCKLLICDKNEFVIKRTIEHDDLESNFLIYIPSERPIDSENWLLDILMYSEEYYADTVALTMRRLGLSNTDLRRVIENHVKFFDSEARVKKLRTYVNISNETQSVALKNAMMATLVKAQSNSIDSILTELVFDGSEQAKYNEIRKYNLEDHLWNVICDRYNYDGDLKIETLIKKFIFTTFIEQTKGQNSDLSNPFDNIASFYTQYLTSEKGENDAKFFIDNLKRDERYENLQSSLALDLKIEGLIAPKDISAIQFADVFECLDIEIINKVATSLASGSIEFDSLERILMNRINSMWHEKYGAEYGLLIASVRFLRKLDNDKFIGLTSLDYIDKYIESYFKIDKEYRNVVTNYRMIANTSEEFDNLIDAIENKYQNEYLDVLGPEFSKSLKDNNLWDFYGHNMSKDFYNIIQRNPAKKIFVIISDALRYEAGHELYEKIKSNKVLKGGVEIDHMISPLPSITSLGMASLLPHRKIEYKDKQVFVDDMPTNGLQQRNAILNSRNSSYAAISFEDINSMTQKEIRAYCSDKSLVYIYHDVIDNAGEHNEKKVFDVVPTCIDEILNLVKKLYNNLQITNFYITADHGFIYRRNTIHESNKYSNITSLPTVETSKRYLIVDDKSITVPFTNEIDLSEITNDDCKLIAATGYDLFKTQGGGIQYIHGGLSLQETIVPLIHVSELRSKTVTENVRPVSVRLKSITRKITNRSFTLEFEQMEKVEDRRQAISCETYIVDENGNKVSAVYQFVANSSSDDQTTRITKIRFSLQNIQFNRNKPYFLILKNVEDTDYIEKEQFSIDIIQFKMF